MNRVLVKFPKVGLGNMMLIWARGVVFSHINKCTYITTGWWGFRWGALFRKEKRNRIYFNYFIEPNFWSKHVLKFQLLYQPKVYNPPITIKTNFSDPTIIVFDKVVIDNDLFQGLRDYRKIVIEELNSILHPRIKSELKKYSPPKISVHVRRGDFKLGNTLTPLSFFIEGIKQIRKLKGEDISVVIFSDADELELAELFLLDNITLSTGQSDILDLLQMGSSKVIFLSQSSSFSYWSAFISEALVIIPEADWQHRIAYDDAFTGRREIKWDPNKEDLNSQFYEAVTQLQF